MENDIAQLILDKISSLEDKVSTLYNQINLHSGLISRIEKLEARDSTISKIWWILTTSLVTVLVTMLVKKFI